MAESMTGLMISGPVKKLDLTGLDRYETVVYWHEESCVEPSPYRAIVRWTITELQNRYRVEILDEGPEMQHEEIGYQDLSLNGQAMQIYWDNTLGFMSFMSTDAKLLEQTSKYLAGKKPPKS